MPLAITAARVPDTLVVAALAIVGAMIVLWLLSLPIRDSSIVGIF